MAENKPAAAVKPVAAPNKFAALKTTAQTVAPASVLTDKKTLVGKAFLITEWQMVPSDSKQRKVKYAEVSYVLEDGTEGKFRDASRNGIREQLLQHIGQTIDNAPINEKHTDPILVESGLSVQEFDFENEKGVKTKSNVYTL